VDDRGNEGGKSVIAASLDSVEKPEAPRLSMAVMTLKEPVNELETVDHVQPIGKVVSMGTVALPTSKEALDQIEKDARGLSQNVTRFLASLQAVMAAAGQISLQHTQTFSSAMDGLTNAVSDDVQSAHDLITKVEELLEEMAPIKKMAVQIKDIKKLLDTLERGNDKVVSWATS